MVLRSISEPGNSHTSSFILNVVSFLTLSNLASSLISATFAVEIVPPCHLLDGFLPVGLLKIGCGAT